jgi:hypothetical protein
MRHIFILPIAAALVFEPLAFNSDRAEAMMMNNPGLERFADALSPIEKTGWHRGWHGGGWHRGWHGGGWHRGWHGGGWHGGGWHRR